MKTIDLVDFTTGAFGKAKKVYCNRCDEILVHPDSGITLDGYIEKIEELRETVIGISRRFSTLEWMGFDIGITDMGFKCMEINSHPGIKYMQIFEPLLNNKRVKKYIENKLQMISDYDSEQLLTRNNIPR